MKASHLKKYIIEPTLHYISLEDLNLCSEDAVQLLLGTAAQESHLGEYLHEIKGNAKGIYQEQISDHEDIWDNYLQYRDELFEKVTDLSSFGLTFEENLIGNLYYATAIARIHYLRIRELLPNRNDIHAMAVYWKKYYNSKKGKGTVIEFIENYNRLVLEEK